MELTKLTKDRLNFLKETVHHYTANNRGVRRLGHNAFSCSYAAGCAIGRKVSPQLAKKLDQIAGPVDEEDIYRELPEQLRELGGSFLADVQQLHDVPEHWTDTGISEYGIDYLNYILRYHFGDYDGDFFQLIMNKEGTI